jgi:hypothetical protein
MLGPSGGGGTMVRGLPTTCLLSQMHTVCICSVGLATGMMHIKAISGRWC